MFSLINNLSSLESQSSLSVTGQQLNQTIQQLSSGLRINNSGDDAAGLAIANSYRNETNILNQGVRNANDGLSTLQTIDGGLSNISSLLDRASTLAAQSASDTFTGDRSTLQNEFSSVLGEISREAQNIGLVQGGANNKSLTAIIGGGSQNYSTAGTNNGVSIDLSGATNQVDAAGLGINSLNIGASTGTVTAAGSGALNFSTPGAALGQAETITYQYVGASGSLTSGTVSLSSGQTANSALAQLQSDAGLKDAGISVGTDSNGHLQFSSAGFFTVKSSVAGTTSNSTGIGTSTVATGAANSASLTGVAATAADTQKLDFTIGNSSSIVQISYSTSTTAATNAANIAAAINGNQTLQQAGIFAVNDAGSTGVQIVSTQSTFNLNVENANTASANNGVAAGTQTVTAGTSLGGAQGARAALDALTAAVKQLGRVQGKVGAGENHFQQAINLANSQVTNVTAAESQIRDANVSAQASNLSRLTVLQQAGVAALAQANQSNQAVLSLLR